MSPEVEELKERGNYAKTSAFSKYMKDAVKFDLSIEGRNVRDAVENLRESIVEGKEMGEIKLKQRRLFEKLDNLSQHTDSDFFDKVKDELETRVSVAVYASQSVSESSRRNAAEHIMPSDSFTSFPIDWRINNIETGYSFTPEKSIAQKRRSDYGLDAILKVSIPRDYVISNTFEVQYNSKGELNYNGVPFEQCVIDLNSNEGYQKTRYRTTEKEVAVLFDLRPNSKAPIEILEVTKYD